MCSANPTVSVVLPVYNRVAYVEEAVESILSQTLEDFEFIIIDDGSTDGSGDLLSAYAQADKRIRLRRRENRGLITSLNEGIDMARGHYIARMDSDDCSYPQRFVRQVAFLDRHPAIGVVGSKIEFIDADGQVNGAWPMPTNPDMIAWKLLFNNCLCHPSVMMRRSALAAVGGYATWAEYAEDYELWTRLLQTTRIANLPDVLLKFRRHDDAVTIRKRTEQIRRCCDIATRLHRVLLREHVNPRLSAFLVWMEVKGIDEAIAQTGVEDLAVVHHYLRLLYGQYVEVLLKDDSNSAVRQQALARCDRLARRIGTHEGHVHGLRYMLEARFMAPGREILPWGLQAVQRRVAS